MDAHGGHQSVYEGMKYTGTDCEWKALDFSGCNSRPGTGSLHPVAIETAAEATKLSELSM
jgi:hypothetical protein